MSVVTLNDIIYRLNDDIIRYLKIFLINFVVHVILALIYLFNSFLASGEFKLSSADNVCTV